MSECDYTPAARRAYLANQSYVAKWASQSTPSPHTSFSGSPMTHRSHMPFDSPYSLYDLPSSSSYSSSSHSSSSYSSRSSASRSHLLIPLDFLVLDIHGHALAVHLAGVISRFLIDALSSESLPPCALPPPPWLSSHIPSPQPRAPPVDVRHRAAHAVPPRIHAEGIRRDYPPGPGWGVAGRVLLNPVAVVGSRAFVRRGRRGTRACGHCGSAARCWTCLDFYLLDFPYTHSRIYRSTQPSTDESLRTVCCYDTHTHGIKCNRGTNYIFNAARIRRCGCTKQNKVEVM
ncbi:hypothetical protein B0H13DRAFT_2673774, partial [Mycena leptocephala]